MKLPDIVNTVEVSGEVYAFESLPDNEQREIAIRIQDMIMAAAGYKRKTA
ncbi:MAG: hypothetical protein LUH04_12830 [Clostridium sp.]|nr:hypothetical protein [Clostridium sp.]